MGTYQNIVDFFDEFEIENEQQLGAALEFGSETREVGGTSQELTSLGGKITKELAHMDYGASSPRLNWGIQQHSMSEYERVSEEHIKKSLFLSRRANIYTKHQFSVDFMREDTYGDHPIFRMEERLSYDRDFIFDLYKYRDLIKRGEIRLIPASISKTKSEYYMGHWKDDQHSENITLLEELRKCNVLSLSPNSTFVDAMISKYEQNQQLIHLPNMSVPWISGLSIKDITRVKADHQDAIDKFQLAYHDAILEHIKNYRSVNFRNISQQIQEDIIQPNLSEIERKYKKSITLHRSLALAGGVVFFIPLVMAIVNEQLFNKDIIDITSLFPPILSGMISSFGLNKIKVQSEKKTLEENNFYIIWFLQKGK